MTGWIEIFRAGEYPQGTFTEEDIDEMIETFNPAEYEPPVVVGHPRDDSPAWGWVKELKRIGKSLYARFGDMTQEFIAWLDKKLYKNRSIKIAKENGKWRLIHVGFLGATPPAIKGLSPLPAFSSIEGVEIEFQLDETVQIEERIKWTAVKNIFKRMREWIIERFGLEEANKVLPGYDVEQFAATEEEREAQQKRSKKYRIGIKEGGHVTKPKEWEDVDDDDFLDPVNYRYPVHDEEHTRAAARYWGVEKNRAPYSKEEQEIITRQLEEKMKKFKIGKYREEEKEMTEKIIMEREAELQEELKKKDQEIERLKKEKNRIETKIFLDNLASQGKFLPAWEKMGIFEFMDALQSLETAEIQFSESEKINPLQWFKRFLEKMPKFVEFAEVCKDEKEKPEMKTQFSKNVDEERLMLHEEATKLSKKESITYRDALLKILKKEV